ncbi:hypothetical protein WR25_14975 isoform C [Diploscapter pachys]|uniref:NADAR domain-containing protein n=1 Tax=Diploscapter pachys TaxID=2018661 RepID=A0A2A2LS48_9BILA|nr:hypothetical protein WR25_14975 isoform C [Diploscapter pachys]
MAAILFLIIVNSEQANNLLRIEMGRTYNEDSAHLQQDVNFLKQEISMIRNAVVLLETEKDNLRQAVRKLKLENARLKEKVRRINDKVRAVEGKDGEESNEEEVDYDDIGKDFILVGGAQDPLSIRYEVTIVDDQSIEHKSAERYYWLATLNESMQMATWIFRYKMAEYFGDADAMEKIRSAPNTAKAEEAMKDIKGFDEKSWNDVKMKVWEKGQTFKFEQVRWITNLLIETGSCYIAVSHQDKMFGTGWRKNREESNKPIFWDGKNMGGKFLMRYRKKIAADHSWTGPAEKEETHHKYMEMKRFVWRRIDPAVRAGIAGPRGALRGGFRGCFFFLNIFE